VSFELSRPLLLLALPLLLFIPWLAARDQRRSPRRRRWAAVLRIMGMAALILALAEPRMRWPVSRVAVAFLVDRSDSVPAKQRALAESLMAEAVDAMPAGDRAAVVAFGERALLDRAAREGPAAPIRSQPGRGGTDLASALRLGQTALPADAGRRIVVLSDGRANLGALDAALRLARARGVVIDALPLQADLGEGEMLIAALEAPPEARVGQNVRVEAVVRAPQGGEGRLQLFDGERMLLDERLRIAGGDRRVGTTVVVEEPGFHRFRALFTPDADVRPENNATSAFTLVAGPPRVLVLSSDVEQAAPLIEVLEAAGRRPELRPPDAAPTGLLELVGYDAVVLVDVAAREMSDSAEEALLAYVRDQGGGLLMIGGEHSFGSGGWRHSPVEKAMPVEMEVRDKERRPEIAIAYVIDKSSSMSAGPGSHGFSGGGGGVQNVDLAKEAALLSASLLQPSDRVALVAFDSSSHLLWPLHPHERPGDFEAAVSGIRADGGTNIQAGLEAGLKELVADSAPLKHLILLSDGQSDSSGYDALLERMQAEGVTLTTVAIGGSAPVEMARLADLGGGRHYPVLDSRDLPSIFVEDTLTALGTFIIEESFRPVAGARSPVLAGLDVDTLPPLHGYNGVEARDSATVALWSHLEDPVLAHGQYGLGRSAAWTPDLKRQWSSDWLDWPGFGAFVVQMVDWVTPPPGDQDFGLETRVEAGRARIALSAVDADGSPASLLEVSAVLSGPGGRTVELELPPQGAGLYAAEAVLPSEGTWLLRVDAREPGGQRAGGRTAGLVVPYSPEYADPASEPVDPRLARLTTETGGRILSREEVATVSFDRIDGVTRPVPLWSALVLLAALLLPADVAVRRLRLPSPSRAALGAWLRRSLREIRLPARVEHASGAGPVASAARREGGPTRAAVARGELPSATPASRAEPPDPMAEGSAAKQGPSTKESQSVEEEDTFSRLRRAKQRARRR
jgi:uncharacterized membrane protein